MVCTVTEAIAASINKYVSFVRHHSIMVAVVVGLLAAKLCLSSFFFILPYIAASHGLRVDRAHVASTLEDDKAPLGEQ